MVCRTISEEVITVGAGNFSPFHSFCRYGAVMHKSERESHGSKRGNYHQGQGRHFFLLFFSYVTHYFFFFFFLFQHILCQGKKGIKHSKGNKCVTILNREKERGKKIYEVCFLVDMVHVLFTAQ